MASAVNLGNLCRYILECEEERDVIDDPVHMGAVFREYAGIQRIPSLKRTISLVKSLGIRIEAADYLKTGGTNMNARGCWHIHYSANDKPATRKFTIFHELFEIIHKSLGAVNPECNQLKGAQLCRCADRFAASALIPQRFFLSRVYATGCDLVKLSDELELSHQCLLMALGQHLLEIPFVGVLYEHRLDGETGAKAGLDDFVATVVVKTARARRTKDLCGLQTVPKRNGKPKAGSLVCAAITGGHSLLWRSSFNEDAPVILVRPLISAGGEAYRVILLAVPGEEFGMISLQVDIIEPIQINGDMVCPTANKCGFQDCLWKPAGGLQ